MKRTIQQLAIHGLAIVTTLLLLPRFALAQTPLQAKLPEGTEVRLKLMQALSSGTVQAGQTISFQVLDEIKVDDVVVIAEGAPAWGTITEAEGKKTMGRGGKLAVQIDYVKAVDGSKVPLRSNSVAQGKGRGAAVGVATTASVLFFWPAAPFFLLMKGKNVEIPRGQHVAAFVDGDRMINAATAAASATPATVQRIENNGGGIVAASTRHAATGQVDFGTINVLSEPGGAEVEVDDAYYGNTPALLKLPAGMHTITVRSAHHAAWSRTLNIGAGSNLTVKAELTKAAASVRRASAR
ncbi:MAG: PEGA domain-containing protein [Blastocatellia bacterium]